MTYEKFGKLSTGACDGVRIRRICGSRFLKFVEEWVLGLCQESKGSLMSYLMTIWWKKLCGVQGFDWQKKMLALGCKEEGKKGVLCLLNCCMNSIHE